MIEDELLADIRFALRGLDPWPPKRRASVRALPASILPSTTGIAPSMIGRAELVLVR